MYLCHILGPGLDLEVSLPDPPQLGEELEISNKFFKVLRKRRQIENPTTLYITVE